MVTGEPIRFGKYARAANEAALCVQLTESNFSNHFDSGYVETQQGVYSQSNRTRAEWEELMRRGVIQNITSQCYLGACSVLFVDSIAEWDSGLANNFTIATSGYSDTSITQSELEKKVAGNCKH